MSADRGEVLLWEPPRRLVYLWHLRFDRSAVAEERRERNRRGWAGVLEHYRGAAA